MANELLVKFRKSINIFEKNLIFFNLDEQFVVNRIAQSTIDIFAMFVVLSRASRTVNNKGASSEHEVNLANLFCSEVCQRFKTKKNFKFLIF